ncbi:hypothetical protein J2Z23_000014 [Lederbergia galactosidilyticus]|nr:hypothetical protein [Lederbergia galactosidilytica]
MGFALTAVNLRKFTANHHDLDAKIEKGEFERTKNHLSHYLKLVMSQPFKIMHVQENGKKGPSDAYDNGLPTMLTLVGLYIP